MHAARHTPEMLARARKKANKAGTEITFERGIVEALPFPDCQFDAVLSTVMLTIWAGPLANNVPKKCEEF